MSVQLYCIFARLVRQLVFYLSLSLAVFFTSESGSTAQQQFAPIKPHLNVGVLGQTEHGNAALTSAITKVLSKAGRAHFISIDEIKKVPGERTRGMSMRIRYVEYETEKRHYAHLYGASHRDYVKALITGAANLDGAILVVSASAGPTQQTREQTRLASQVGIPSIVVFLDNADVLDNRERLALVERQVRDLLCTTGRYCDRIPVIPGSSLRALDDVPGEFGQRSILNLMKAMDTYIPDPVRITDKPFLMPVEDVFTITGRGPVVTGRVEWGRVRVQDEVEIVGLRPTKKTVATGVEMFRKLLDEAQAGDNVGVLLGGIRRDEVERGQVLARPGSITPHSKFEAAAYFLDREEGGRLTPIFKGYRPQFYFRTTDVTGVLALPEGQDRIMPGENVTIVVGLSSQIAMQPGLRFAIREGGRTVGAGVVVQIIRE